MLTENTSSALKTLAFVNEVDLIPTKKEGREVISFDFSNSLKADHCDIVEYNIQGYKGLKERYIVQFKKNDKLINESIIKPQEFNNVFQKVTGIYLNYLN